MSMKTLTIANQKGGVGKSALAFHIICAAADAGLKVLAVDMDKQGSLSLCFPANKAAPPRQALVTSQLFEQEPDLLVRPETVTDRIDIIRPDSKLLRVDGADAEVIRRPGKALHCLADDYGLCVIDTPPLLGVRLMASLTAADYVVTPVAIGLFELAGVADLLQTIDVIRSRGFNQRLKHIGILPTKINARSRLECDTLERLRTKYGPIIFKEELPERAAVRQAIAKRRPVWAATHGSGHLKAAQEWRAACGAILGSMA